MKIGICSGYFQRFHEGHKAYIQSAIDACDFVIVIINNHVQQREKYAGFQRIKSFEEIQKEIQSAFANDLVMTTESLDTDASVCKTLLNIRRFYPDEKLYFCKDADRSIDNIPETKVMEQANIQFMQFNNKKINSSTKIMQEEQ